MSITDYMDSEGMPEYPGLKPAFFTMGRVAAPDQDTRKGTVRVRIEVMEKGRDVLNSVPVVSPYAGNAYGSFLLPEEGDLVLILFEGAAFCNPVVMGCRFPQDSSLVKEHAGDKNPDKVLCLKNSGGIAFTGEKGKEKVRLHTPAKLELAMEEEQEKLSLGDTGHKNQLTVQSKEGKLLVQAEQELCLKCGKSTISLKKDGTVHIQGEKVEISAKTIQVKGQSQVDIQGQETSVRGKTGVTVNGQSKVTVKSSGQVKVSGAMIQLN